MATTAMAMATPMHKTVHWNSQSPGIDSPSQSSEESFVSTSSLQYVNSQLVAHGFTTSSGLSLDGLSKGELDRAVKCFLDLLTQRVKDMSRTEQLSTELRTLRYDYERMVSMHRTATESAANFEREVNLQKSRLATTTKTLQATESAHKHTNAELQRTRSALQTIRATHQAESKKKEKEIERAMERWHRISDAQAKLGATASGMRFIGSTNTVVEPVVPIVGRGKNYLEIALEEAEKAREQLSKDNLGLKKMLLKAVNEIRNIAFELASSLREPTNEIEVPVPMTLPDLFPLSPPEFTTMTLSSSLARLRDILAVLSSSTSSISTSSPSVSPAPQPMPSPSELEQLHQVIEQLKNELHDSKEQVALQAAENRFAADQPSSTMTILTRDDKRQHSAVSEAEERKKLPQVPTQPGTGKERLSVKIGTRSKDEKPSEKIRSMFAELPLTRDDSDSRSEKMSASNRRFSPREPHSPSKRFQINVGKATTRTTRVGSTRRRSSSSSFSLSPSKGSKDAEPAFETEVIPRLPPPPSIGASIPPLMSASSSTESLLPTAFVLPPPSPCASLPPPKPALLISGASTLPLLMPTFQTSQEQELCENDRFLSQSSLQTHAPSATPGAPVDPVPQTPLAGAHRAFLYPVAKPLATHMIHAYSPVRPSPLSRILMLGNSPGSPSNIGLDPDSSSRGLETLMETDELENDFPGDGLLKTELFPSTPQSRASSDDEGGLTLAQQLGVSESPPESPVYTRPDFRLREKKVQSNVVRRSHSSKSISNKARIPSSKPTFGVSKLRTSSTVEKGSGTKVKAKSMGTLPVTKNTTRMSDRLTSVGICGYEKENSSHASGSAGSNLKNDKGIAERSSTKSVVLDANLRKVDFGRGVSGPRRVPIDSAEAPPIGRRRKP
ncbi:Afadin and alpha-actinin-binding-domain-containing protein [Lentinula aff. lateritia]|uniref:Afadin and alpha-actinin-binding-domain-containing protein n=1 Tax=Lentinula aff. lateritia TaxID=2804960 RepID=A0ACC1TZR4_9AGAR|nr:Afadin and alpha-actinin-binding-domain-containing protein [Lentinula aff. lateritia]